MEHINQFVKDLNEGGREIELQFTDHPESQGTTYSHHLLQSLLLSARSCNTAVQHLIHGICPIFCSDVCHSDQPEDN